MFPANRMREPPGLVANLCLRGRGLFSYLSTTKQHVLYFRNPDLKFWLESGFLLEKAPLISINYFFKDAITGFIAATKAIIKNQAQWVFITQLANPLQREIKNNVALKTASLVNPISHNPKFLKFITYKGYLAL